MQTRADTEGRYLLEHQMGSTDRHYQAADTALPVDTVLRAFLDFAQRGTEWHTSFEWVKIDIVK